PGVARDLRPPSVYRIGRRLQRRDAERRFLRAAGGVHVDLHEIGAQVELCERRVLQPLVIRGDPHVGVTGLPNPGSGDADVRVSGLALELVADVERDGTAVGHRSADVARPQHAGLDETLGVLARDLPQYRRRIVATSDPVAATLHGQM